MSTTPISRWAEQLDELSAAGLRRTLRCIESPQGPYVMLNGRRVCCFCSNNYLGLANHPHVVQAVKNAIDQWGWGAGASRLVCGHMTPHQQLETRLAAFKGTQAALICSSGYQANVAAIRGLAGADDVVLLDKLDHGSIIDAARGSGADMRVFPHRDYDKLEQLLQRSASVRRRVIVTDSLFSMNGDVADLPRLVELKHKYDALLCVDEAHATGVFGEHGRGVAEAMGVEAHIDAIVGTLSKALGGIGGYVAGSADFIDWLINTAGSFIYTTALPPAVCAGAIAALDIVEREPQRRQTLLARASRLRNELGECRGLDIAGSSSHIVPLIVGEADAALQLSRQLEEAGILIPAIRPPTVPRGSARLRISMSCEHEDEEIDNLLSVLDRHAPTTRFPNRQP